MEEPSIMGRSAHGLVCRNCPITTRNALPRTMKLSPSQGPGIEPCLLFPYTCRCSQTGKALPASGWEIPVLPFYRQFCESPATSHISGWARLCPIGSRLGFVPDGCAHDPFSFCQTTTTRARGSRLGIACLLASLPHRITV